MAAVLSSLRKALWPDRWAWLAPLLTLLGVVALLVIPTVAGPELACRSLRPGPSGFAPAICIMDWTALAQRALGVEFADQVDDVFRIGAVMGLLAVLPPLVPAPAWWRRGVAVVVGVVMLGAVGVAVDAGGAAGAGHDRRRARGRRGGRPGAAWAAHSRAVVIGLRSAGRQAAVISRSRSVMARHAA